LVPVVQCRAAGDADGRKEPVSDDNPLTELPDMGAMRFVYAFRVFPATSIVGGTNAKGEYEEVYSGPTAVLQVRARNVGSGRGEIEDLVLGVTADDAVGLIEGLMYAVNAAGDEPRFLEGGNPMPPGPHT
jgi:hypothetical protein